MSRYVIKNAQGNPVGVIEWDGVSAWSPPDGCTVELEPIAPPPPPPPQSQIDAAARAGLDETERLACKVDPQILPLVNQTKAEWITWAGANFPTLTAAERTRLGILFWVVSVGVRRAIRNGT